MAGEKDARAQHEIFMQKATHITTCQFRFSLLFGIPCLTLRLVNYDLIPCLAQLLSSVSFESLSDQSSVHL